MFSIFELRQLPILYDGQLVVSIVHCWYFLEAGAHLHFHHPAKEWGFEAHIGNILISVLLPNLSGT